MNLSNDDRALAAAARWKARLHAPDCTADDRDAFQKWRDSDARHARAYALAERVATTLDSLHSADPRLQAMLDRALLDSTSRTSRPRRRWAIPASLVAGLASIMIGLRFIAGGSYPAAEPVVYESDDARPRTLELDDGSTVKLDVGARLRVSMSSERRDVELVAGRAIFDVAHDRSRPFVVTAADFRTTALGTRFQVDVQQSEVVVTLAEGRVAIDSDQSDRTVHERLEPGQQLRIDLHAPTHVKLAVDPQLTTSWSEGRLAFRGTRLETALSEVNRYSHRKVRLGDPSLANLPVAGNFIAGDSEAVVTAFAALLPLRVVESGGDEVILFRRYDDRLN